MRRPTTKPDRGAGRRAALTRWLTRWHRRLGITAAVFVILFAVTGIALNHAARLGLDRVEVTAEPILWLYDRTPDSPPVAFPVDERWLTWLDGRLYLDDRPVAEEAARPVGAAATGDLLVLAEREALWLFLSDGTLVERQGPETLPGPVESLGITEDGAVALKAADGLHRATPDLLGWRPADGPVDWSAPAPLPAPLREALLAAWRGAGLPLDRVILDLHSGRLFGGWGVFAADALAVALILLAASGVWMWVRTRRPARRLR